MSIVRIAELLRRPQRAFSKDAGFTLIEVIASLFIFTLLTLGLVPLLTSSIKGSNTARADTVGKNAALKAMERVRGLPFYVSYATSTSKVDVLDLYYPSGATDIVVGGRTLYRTTCAWNGPLNPACPNDIPDDYTITFEAQFVDPVASGAQPAVGETATSYNNVPTPATYMWNSTSADTPPRQILQMAVITTWTVGSSSESYTLTSLLSDRSFGGRKLKATGTLGYGVNVFAAYDTKKNTGSALESSANMFVGQSESDIEGRRVSSARQATTAARGELELATGGSLAVVDGATSSQLVAPPDQSPADVSAPSRTLGHPHFSNAPILSFGASTVSSLTALATSGMPSATGDLSLTGVISGTSEYLHSKDPQLNNADFNSLHLSTAGTNGPSIVSFVRVDGLPGPLPGITAPATTGATVVGGSRAQTLTSSVHSQATTGFDRTLLLKSDWIPDPAPIFGGGTLSGGQGSIVVIDNFQAAAYCDSNSNGTGSAEALYQGTLYYWEDPTNNGNRTDGRYRSVTFNVSSATSGADPLAAVMAQNPSGGQGNGPLIYDANSANQDVYMFGKTLGATEGGGKNAERMAYLTTWNSLTTTAKRIDALTDAAGAAVAGVTASMDGAISIETADFDTTKQVEAVITFSFGSLSCYAEDAR